MKKDLTLGATRFRAWITKQGYTQREVGKRLEWDTSYLCRLLTGRSKPATRNAYKIQEFTKRAVKITDWLDEA
jgi:transcriptional regulator with XRE-family HTH domain